MEARRVERARVVLAGVDGRGLGDARVGIAGVRVSGIARATKDPLKFDRISIAAHAAEFHISPQVIEQVISTGSQAVLFLPADRFSAYAAFAPVVESVKVSNPALDKLGDFKADTQPIGNLAKTAAEAQRVFDRAGFR